MRIESLQSMNVQPMKYFILICLCLVFASTNALASPDTTKTTKGTIVATSKDSCEKCDMHEHGAMMGKNCGMCCERGAMMHGGNGRYDGEGEHEGMHRGVGMVVHIIFVLLGMIAFVLLIMIELHWLRLLSMRVKRERNLPAA